MKDFVSNDIAILSYRQAMPHVKTLQRACRVVKLLSSTIPQAPTCTGQRWHLHLLLSKSLLRLWYLASFLSRASASSHKKIKQTVSSIRYTTLVLSFQITISVFSVVGKRRGGKVCQQLVLSCIKIGLQVINNYSQYFIVPRIVAPFLQNMLAPIEDMPQCVGITTEGASRGNWPLPLPQVGVVGKCVLGTVHSKVELLGRKGPYCFRPVVNLVVWGVGEYRKEPTLCLQVPAALKAILVVFGLNCLDYLVLQCIHRQVAVI